MFILGYFNNKIYFAAYNRIKLNLCFKKRKIIIALERILEYNVCEQLLDEIQSERSGPPVLSGKCVQRDLCVGSVLERRVSLLFDQVTKKEALQKNSCHIFLSSKPKYM